MRLIHRTGIRSSVFVAALTSALASSFAPNDAIGQQGEALTLVQTIPLPDVRGLADMRGNFPMALDDVGDRLFVVTRQPAVLLVYDVTTGKRVASVPVAGDADDIFFGRRRRRLYLVCGEGVVDIVRQQDADRYDVIGRLPTAKGARTGLFVPAQRLLYVAVPARQAAHAEIRVYQAGAN